MLWRDLSTHGGGTEVLETSSDNEAFVSLSRVFL